MAVLSPLMPDGSYGHAIFMFDQEIVNISSLEIKRLTGPTRAVNFALKGWAIKPKLYKLVFMGKGRGV